MIITLTAQLGGRDAGEIFRSELVKVRKSLKLLEDKFYSNDLKKAKILLRIGGEIESYNDSSGIFKSRLEKKSGVFSAEIIISKKSWEKGVDTNKLLFDSILSYFRELINYSNHKKINFDSVNLLNDVAAVLME